MSDFDFWTADLIKTYFAMLVSRKKKYELVGVGSTAHFFGHVEKFISLILI